MYFLRKLFSTATFALPKLSPISPKYRFYKIIEQLFIFSNRYYPIYRKNVPNITQKALSKEHKNSNIYINKSFFYQKKKLGVSGVARLKNADEFLNPALESYLPFLDELILVDNNSTDNTIEICQEFVSKYPKKVKFYQYTPDVLHYGLHRFHPHTNPHSLAYYYNWCFAKATYSHVVKVDDDHIALLSPYTKLVEKILRENKAGFYATRGLNILKKDEKLGVYSSYPCTGKYGDHGIYKITPQTYYVQNNSSTENLLHPYRRFAYEFAFLHLKRIKKSAWINMTDKTLYNQLKEQSKITEVKDFKQFISLEQEKEIKHILSKIL